MRIRAYRGEKSVAEIVDKSYRNLNEDSRRELEALLVERNPELTKLSKLKRGTLLRLPDAPGAKAKEGRGSGDPETELTEQLLDDLKRYAKVLDGRYAERLKEIDEQVLLLKDRTFKKVVGDSPDARVVTEALSGNLAEAQKATKQRRAQAEKLLAGLQKQLAERKR
ncbi:MAG: hypothetical protein VX663_09605 [Pseudomonadota bacterium]|nr:hypothetical protein [Pseudomonadota bacterium]